MRFSSWWPRRKRPAEPDDRLDPYTAKVMRWMQQNRRWPEYERSREAMPERPLPPEPIPYD